MTKELAPLAHGAIELLVLDVLDRKGEMYGYQLLAELRSREPEVLVCQEGTLYPLLYRLEGRKFLESTERSAPSGKTRRYYRLNKDGRVLLAERKAHFSKLFSDLSPALTTSYAAI